MKRAHANRSAALSGPPMRILMVAPQPFFEERGSPIALRHTLEAYSALGCHVDVLTFPTGRDVEIPGVHYHRVANPLRFRSIPIGLSAKKLFLDGLVAAWMVSRRLRRTYHMVHAVEEAAFLASVFARGIPVLYDMQSSLPEQLAQSRPFRLRPLRAACDALERWLLRHVDQVVASAGLGVRVRRLAPRTPVEEWLYPAAAPEVAPEELAILRRDLALPEGAPVVLYAGNWEDYQGLPMLLDAIPDVLEERPDVAFVLVGARSAKQDAAVRQRIGGVARSAVRTLPRQSHESISRYLALADVLVSTRRPLGNAPLKIFDYLASGKPIVATDVPAHRALLDETCAHLVAPEPTALARALLDVLGDPARAHALGAGAIRRGAELSAGFRDRLGAVCERLAKAGTMPPAP